MILCCIPAYNEEKSIAKVILTAKNYCDKVVVCDDGSTDATAAIAEALGAEMIYHASNTGYGASIASLFDKAIECDADFMVTLDADGQHNPREIDRLLGLLDSRSGTTTPDIVIGSRFLGHDKTSAYRKTGINVINALTMTDLTDTQSGFRAYNRRAMRAVRPTELGMSASTEILTRALTAGLKIVEVPINVSYDEESHTHNSVAHGLDVAVGTIKQLSIKHALLFYGVPGTILTLIAIFFGAWTLYLWPIKHYIVTNLALATVFFGVFGLQLELEAIRFSVLISVIRERN